MSLIDDFANNNLVQGLRNRFVSLVGGGPAAGNTAAGNTAAGTPAAGSSAGSTSDPNTRVQSARAPDISAADELREAVSDGRARDNVRARFDTPPPSQGLGEVLAQRNPGALNAPGTPSAAGDAYRARFAPPPGPNLADTIYDRTMSAFQNERAAGGATPAQPSAQPSAPTASADSAAYRARFDAPSSGPNLAETIAQRSGFSDVNGGRAAPGAPTGAQPGGWSDVAGGRPGAPAGGWSDGGGAPRGPWADAGGAGNGNVPPSTPGAAAAEGDGFFGRLRNAAANVRGSINETLAPANEALGRVLPGGGGGEGGGMGNGLIARGARAAGSFVGGVASKVGPWVEPAIESARTAGVAMQPNSTGVDVVEQAGSGAVRAGTTAAGAALGGAVGSFVPGPGTVLGGIAGGIAGYAGGDAALHKMRQMLGLPVDDPLTRNAREPVKLTKSSQQRVGLIDAPKTLADGTPIYDNPNDADAAQLEATAQRWAAGKPGPLDPANLKPQPAATQPAGAPAQAGIATQLAALRAAQEQSPIAYTANGGNGNGPLVYYKDGSMAVLPPGTPLPQEVSAHQDRQRAIAALTSGAQPAPAAAGAPAQNGLTPIQQNIYASASARGVDPTKALTIAALESKFDPNAKNGESSATSLFQLLGSNRAKYGLPAKPTNTQAEIEAGLNFIADNDAALAKNLGRTPSLTESYAGHLFGAKGASVVLGADPNAPLQQVVASYDPKKAADIVNKNRFTGMTVGQAIAALDAKVQKASAQFGAPAAGTSPAGVSGTGGYADAPLLPAGSDFQRPVQILRPGGVQTVAMPLGGPAMQEIPGAVYQQGLANNNIAAAARAYLDNAITGANYANNPTAAKLAEEAVKGGFQVQTAATTGGAHVAAQTIAGGSQIATERERGASNERVANTQLTQSRNAVIANPEEVGKDVTGAPIIKDVPYLRDPNGVPQRAVPQPRKSEQAMHTEARAAIAAGAPKEAVNARLVAEKYNPLP